VASNTKSTENGTYEVRAFNVKCNGYGMVKRKWGMGHGDTWDVTHEMWRIERKRKME
jgi:hypothetical protein